MINTVARPRNLLANHKPVHRGCRTTGGNTGIPWGTGGVWLEPVNEEAAQSTVDRLQQFWHRKAAGYSMFSSSTARTNQSLTALSGADHAATSADAGGSDSEGSVTRMVGSRGQHGPEGSAAVNTVCLHAACSPHAFCLVEQLEVVRDSYGKSRTVHFNRKPILVGQDALRRTAVLLMVATAAHVDEHGRRVLLDTDAEACAQAAINQVATLDAPLRSADVPKLNLGKKTAVRLHGVES